MRKNCCIKISAFLFFMFFSLSAFSYVISKYHFIEEMPEDLPKNCTIRVGVNRTFSVFCKAIHVKIDPDIEDSGVLELAHFKQLWQLIPDGKLRTFEEAKQYCERNEMGLPGKNWILPDLYDFVLLSRAVPLEKQNGNNSPLKAIAKMAENNKKEDLCFWSEEMRRYSRYGGYLEDNPEGRFHRSHSIISGKKIPILGDLLKIEECGIEKKEIKLPSICIAGGTTSFLEEALKARFKAKETTFTDRAFNLEWSKKVSERITYPDAEKFCKNNSLGLPGEGWRIPTDIEVKNSFMTSVYKGLEILVEKGILDEKDYKELSLEINLLPETMINWRDFFERGEWFHEWLIGYKVYFPEMGDAASAIGPDLRVSEPSNKVQPWVWKHHVRCVRELNKP